MEAAYERNEELNLATAQSNLASESSPEDREYKDLPAPIFYNDAFGKASLTFSGPKGSDPMKPIGIVYSELDRNEKPKHPVFLEDYLSPGFYFVRNPHSKFSTGTTDGDSVVYFSWEHLNSSRKYLFALAHEIRHTHQAEPINKLLDILLSPSPQKTVQQLMKDFPQLEEYILDLYSVVMLAQSKGKTRDGFVGEVRNHGGRGVELQGLTPNLSNDFDDFIRSLRSAVPTPLGPIHPCGYFFTNPTLSSYPAIFHIIDPMAERMAWETALPMDKSYDPSGVIQCGFHSMGERIKFMYSGLRTYDQKYRIDNYSRWLKSLAK